MKFQLQVVKPNVALKPHGPLLTFSDFEENEKDFGTKQGVHLLRECILYTRRERVWLSGTLIFFMSTEKCDNVNRNKFKNEERVVVEETLCKTKLSWPTQNEIP